MERVQMPSESHWLSTCFLKHGEVTIKQILERRLRLTGGDFTMRVSFTLVGSSCLLLELLPTPKEDVLSWPPLSPLSSSYDTLGNWNSPVPAAVSVFCPIAPAMARQS